MSSNISTPTAMHRLRFTNDKNEFEFAWYLCIGSSLIYIDAFAAHTFKKVFNCNIVEHDNGEETITFLQ